MSVLGIVIVLGIVLGLYAIGVPLINTVVQVLEVLVNHPFVTLVVLLVAGGAVAYFLGVG